MSCSICKKKVVAKQLPEGSELAHTKVAHYAKCQVCTGGTDFDELNDRRLALERASGRYICGDDAEHRRIRESFATKIRTIKDIAGRKERLRK